MTNDTPGEYFSPLSAATGQRRDISERPELTHGCVEFVAPAEYMTRAPMPPVFVFLLDASYASVASGALAAAASAIRAWIAPENAARIAPRTRVALLTYDSSVHYFKLATSSKRPAMLVVSDLDFAAERAPALPDELLVGVAECRPQLCALLDALPGMFAQTRNVGLAFGTAVAAAAGVIRHLGGRILSFVSALPSVGAGAITAARSESPATATAADDNTVAMSQPLQDGVGEYYKNLALDCSRFQVTVDVVCTAAQHCELATLGQLPQITGGELALYPSFDTRRGDAGALQRHVLALLTREIAWEAVYRVRCSKGLRTGQHYGHFFVRSTDLLALPAVDHGKAFAAQLVLADPVPAQGCAAVQSALLYTSSSGERRIRVSTLCLPVVTSPADVFSAADADALVGFVAKLAADKLATARISDAREAVVRKLVDILCAYRTTVLGSNPSSAAATELQLPEQLRNMPLYMLALLKHNAFVAAAATEVRPDMRSAALAMVRTAPLEHLLVALHPHLFNLTAAPLAPDTSLPPMAALCASSVDPKSVMLCDAGDFLLLHAGRDTPPETLLALFGVASHREIAATVPAGSALPVLENELSSGVRRLVEQLQLNREVAGLAPPRLVVYTDDTRLLSLLLIADRTRNFYSYYEFVNQLQRLVQQRFVR